MKGNLKAVSLTLSILMLLGAILTGCASGGTTTATGTPAAATATPAPATATPAPTASEAATATAAPASGTAWDTTKKDKIVLSVINNYYTAGWKKMATDYTALHPETEVVVDVVADNDTYMQKMTTWLTSSDLTQAADIVHINFAQGAVGGYGVMMQKGLVYNMEPMLKESNPYNNNEPVSACLDDKVIALQRNADCLPALPFDWVGIAVMYNKTLLDKNGIAVPKTFEDWEAACAKLKASGMEAPIAASGEASWFLSSVADAAYRGEEEKFLVQPTDAKWDAAVMAANKDFKFNESDFTCDQYTVFSAERVAAFKKQTKLTDDKTMAVWTQFARIAKYFQTNYTASASTEVLTSFEMGKHAFLVSGSWNVGVLNADIAELGSDGFDWATMAFPDFATAPEGFQAKIRSLYVMGNTMGIIPTHGQSGDHIERVKDFYKFVYNPKGCQDMFETTLNAGNFVQGPPAIKGVVLSDVLNQKLQGFVQAGSVKGDFGGIVGQDGSVLAADKGTFVENLNKLLAGSIDAKKFCQTMSPLWMAYNDDNITKNGYDLDPATADTAKS